MVYGLPKGQGLDRQIDTVCLSRYLEAGSKTKWLVHYNMVVPANAT